MRKMLCPYCDHEIMGKGRCSFCGSKVKKPIYAEVSDDLSARFSTENEDKNYTTEFVEQPEKNSAYAAKPRAKAMLASEAVAESVKKGTNIKGSSTASKIIKIVAIVWIVSTIISVIVNLFLL